MEDFLSILEENYSLDGNKVTLNAFEREFSYEYAENGGNLGIVRRWHDNRDTDSNGFVNGRMGRQTI